MLDRICFRSVFATALLCIVSQPSLAWSVPPTIELTYIDLYTESSSDVTIDGVINAVEDPNPAFSAGYTAMDANTEVAGPDGAVADSEADHQMYIGAYGIAASLFAGADADGVPDSETLLGSRGLNEGEIRFSMPVDASVNIRLHMSIDATGSSFFSGGQGLSRVVLTGTRPDGTAFIFSRLILEDEFENPVVLDADRVYEVKANTEVVLTYTMSAFAGVIFDETHYADTVCDFSVTVLDEAGQPIDADDDGIPDDWEENGVDFNGDGVPEIDLPAIAAANGGGGVAMIGRKTLYVELDAQNGVPVDQDAIQMVIDAFANSPVLNTDLSSGITLVVVTDETDLINQEYNGTAWPQAFDDEKAIHFGTAALRALPNWETEIKPAYKAIFRYGIWGQTMFRDEPLEGGGTKKVYFSGKGERPGNDFFVAAGEVASWYSDAALRRQALAGTFMHEFGHTLGLKHGGQDHDNYKPNYFSIMNYTFQMPSTNVASSGRALSDAWFLDFARTTPSELNETMLREDQGLDGPIGLLTIFNTSADGVSTALQLADADAAEIDWDGSGVIDTEPVSVDITRRTGTEDSYQASVKSYSDWDKLWYPLSGDEQFDDGVHTGAENVEPFTFDQFTLLNTYPVIDLSTPNCPADLNGDGIADQGDIQSFIALFLVQDLAVDFNSDGIVDLGDIQAFIAEFLVGC